MTALLTDNLPLLAGAPNGIKKLRELILELAVRGKLVPQDPSDEPANELLKRIADEKARLVAEGKIKKQKTLVEIAEEETPFAMPVNWAWVRLDFLLKKIGAGSTPLGGKQAYISDGVKFLRSQNVWNEGLRLNDVAFITEETHKKMSGTHVEAGDLLFNITGASIGRCAAVPSDFDTGNVSQHVTIIRPVSGDTQPFLHVVLISQLVQQTVMDVQVGVSREGLSIGKLAQFLIPFPPAAEQHRIVAKVDELMALCDRLEAQQADAESAHAQLVQALLDSLTQASDATDFATNWQRLAEHFHALFTTEPSIDALKQTLLQLAVMGKLVPQDPSDEPASELLQHIAKGKQRLTEAGRLKKQKPIAEISEAEKTFELPVSWEWARLDEIAQVGTGATPLRTNPKYFEPAIISWVTSGETSQDFIHETEQKVAPLALTETNLTVYPAHTLIIAMYGQGKTRGQISELLIDACTNQACAAIQLFDQSESHRRYVKYFFVKSYDDIRLLAAGGAQPNLNLGKVKETVLPLPPAIEQQRIVAKVDQLMAICDQLKIRLTQARELNQQVASTLVEQAVA